MKTRLYHIWAINEQTKKRVCITGYPMPHDKCCNMLLAQSVYPNRRFLLIEEKQP